LSLDEAYLDVTENLKGIISATQIAEEIRARIRTATELTASAGVSTTNSSPSSPPIIASRTGSSSSLPKWAEFVEPCRSGKFHGVGRDSQEDGATRDQDRLELSGQTFEFLQQHFGKAGSYYYWAARGIDKRRPRRSDTKVRRRRGFPPISSPTKPRVTLRDHRQGWGTASAPVFVGVRHAQGQVR
jgi:DNA polymerase-4